MTHTLAAELRADADARRHFRCLDREQQSQAIRRLAAIGHSSSTIADATGLCAEMIRVLLIDGADTP